MQCTQSKKVRLKGHLATTRAADNGALQILFLLLFTVVALHSIWSAAKRSDSLREKWCCCPLAEAK